MEKSQSLPGSFKLSLRFKEVRWSKVLDLLVNRFKLSYFEADKIVKDFFRRFLSSFNLYWFARNRLSATDNSLLAAVCECHAADIIVLRHDKPYKLGPLGIDYAQEIEYRPNLKPSESARKQGSFSAKITVNLFAWEINLNNFWQVLLFQALAVIFATVLYVIISFLFLYALAVFILFLKDPVKYTILATQRASIGLALLCFLVGLAAVSGRVAAYLMRLALGGYRRLRGQGQPFMGCNRLRCSSKKPL